MKAEHDFKMRRTLPSWPASPAHPPIRRDAAARPRPALISMPSATAASTARPASGTAKEATSAASFTVTDDPVNTDRLMSGASTRGSARAQAQAATAATHVAAQDGAPPQSTQPGGGSGSGGNGASGTSSPTAGTGTTPATGTTPVAGSRPSASATPSLVPQAVVGAANPDRAGAGRFVLPAVLIAGLVLVVGGPAGMLYFGTGLAGRLRRLAWWRR